MSSDGENILTAGKPQVSGGEYIEYVQCTMYNVLRVLQARVHQSTFRNKKAESPDVSAKQTLMTHGWMGGDEMGGDGMGGDEMDPCGDQASRRSRARLAGTGLPQSGSSLTRRTK